MFDAAKMTDEELNRQRYSFRKNLLKSVLIRIDYTGINNVDPWIDNNQEFMKEYFNEYMLGTNNNAKIDLTNIPDIANTLSIPISEVQKVVVHTYYNWAKPQTDDVRLSLTSYYLTLNIVCNQYQNIDCYIDLIAQVIEKMYSRFSFLNIHRVGIRKVGGESFKSISEMHAVFKPELFFGKDVEDSYSKPIRREYVDRSILNDQSKKVNYSRQYRYQETPDGERFQTMLDLDCYIDKYNIEQKQYNLKENIKDILSDINLCLFRLFYDSVQESYIESGGVYEQ